MAPISGIKSGVKFTSGSSDLLANSLKALKNSDGLVDGFRAADPSLLSQIPANEMTDILKGLDDVQLAKIGKNLDAGYVKGLDPNMAKKLKPNILGKVRVGATEAINGMKRFRSGAPKKIPRGPNAAKGVETVADVAKKTGMSTDAVKTQSKLFQGLADSRDFMMAGLKKLGYTNIAIAGLVLMLLCMAYDTDNPFTALDKALSETGQSVREIKEIVGEVGGAAGGAAGGLLKGGFNFISFITNNSGLSSASSILCLILIFAAVMMSFLGGNKK